MKMGKDTETRLGRILAHTRTGVAERKALSNLDSMERRAHAHTPRGFAAHLNRVRRSGPAVIAELKKASPSKGLIRAAFDPGSLANTLEAAGAGALSVLTEEVFFRGSLEDLEIASAATSIPCLRKDFMIDVFQVLEARACCADAILLIAAALTDAEMKALSTEASRLGLDVLCEVHDSEELARATQIECQMIGVNSRDLRSFAMHPEVQHDLAEAIPAGVLRVAESGITSAADISRLGRAGYDAFLIGESLMREADPAAALAALLGGAVRAET